MRPSLQSFSLRRLVCGLAIVLGAGAAHGEDIDIYAGPNIVGDLPNVLFILDSSANWDSSIPVPDCFFKDNGVFTRERADCVQPGKEQGTKMAIEKCALYNLIDALPVAKGYDADNDALFNVGFMLLNESPNDGAYPRRAITLLTTNNKAVLKTRSPHLRIGGDKGSNADFAKSMYEAYLYFKGRAPYQGQRATSATEGVQRPALRQPGGGWRARDY